jgi:hypothetical protein
MPFAPLREIFLSPLFARRHKRYIVYHPSPYRLKKPALKFTERAVLPPFSED